MIQPAEIRCTRVSKPATVPVQEVIALLAEHGAVRFANAQLSRRGFAKLTRLYGERHSGDPTKDRDYRWSHPTAALSWLLRKSSRVIDLVTPDDGSRNAPRTRDGINLHNENTFLPSACPDVIWLYCQQAATAGGDSLLCDGREVLRALSAESRQLLESERVRYELTLTKAEWVSVYETQSSEALEQRIGGTPGLKWTLDDAERLQIRFDAEQIVPTKFSGERAVKTNLLSFQPFQALDAGTRERLSNGEPAPVALIQDLLDQTRKLHTELKLNAGDLLMLDNSRVMHGRTPYSDPHRAVVTRLSWLDL